MKTCRALARLTEYQFTILALIDDATALAALPPGDARLRLASARWTAARLLREYQLFKHTEIFDPAIATGGQTRATQARRMAKTCVEAGAAYEAYLRHWSSRDIVAEWADYKPAMLAMTAALRAHLIRERAEVELLLAGSERTRRLDDPPRPAPERASR